MDIVLTVIASLCVNTILATIPDLTQIEHEFSPETFASFNMSKKYEKFNLKKIEEDGRRWDLYFYNWYYAKQLYSYNYNYRTCYFLTMTYLAAIPDIRRYFNLRFLYVNNLDYEVGYLTYSIVRAYQMLIEVYQVMYHKFYELKNYWAAPTSYVFYMYRNALELGMTISHLCNMLHEVEDKYQGNPLGPWDDYPMSDEDGVKKDRNFTNREKDAYDDYNRRRREEYKRRQRQRRKERKEMNVDTKITTPPRRPKKSFWPLHYGWSIEFW